MSRKRKIQVGVIGSNTSASNEEMLVFSERLGKRLIDEGYRIISGGCGGVMEAVSRGAKSSTQHQDGDIIGILPEMSEEKGNPYLDITICTGVGYARNQIICASSDIIVAIGGGAGTLSEMAFAWQLGKPIIACKLEEGWSSKLAGQKLDNRRPDQLHPGRGLNEVIELIDKFIH